MTVDRQQYMNMASMADLDDDAAAILEFKQVATRNGIQTLLDIPTRQQSAVELAKITGMHTDRLELTGKDGGAVEVSELGSIERAARIAAILNAARKRAAEETN